MTTYRLTLEELTDTGHRELFRCTGPTVSGCVDKIMEGVERDGITHPIRPLDQELTCRWEQEEDGYYVTACGKVWTFEYGTPYSNGTCFCPFCGEKITIIPPSVEEK